MSPRSKDWHISGWPAVLLAPFAVPIAILIQFLPIKKTSDRTAEEVAGFLDDFIEAKGGPWDWDDFTSVPIAAPELEAIRREASEIEPPIDQEGLEKLQKLLARAKTLGIPQLK